MAYVKSVLWLAGCGGLAYVLFETITPKDSELIKYLPEGQVHHRADLNQQSSFIEGLKKAGREKRSMIQDKESIKTPSTPVEVGK